jgi:hypothetical protein
MGSEVRNCRCQSGGDVLRSCTFPKVEPFSVFFFRLNRKHSWWGCARIQVHWLGRRYTSWINQINDLGVLRNSSRLIDTRLKLLPYDIPWHTEAPERIFCPLECGHALVPWLPHTRPLSVNGVLFIISAPTDTLHFMTWILILLP